MIVVRRKFVHAMCDELELTAKQVVFFFLFFLTVGPRGGKEGKGRKKHGKSTRNSEFRCFVSGCCFLTITFTNLGPPNLMHRECACTNGMIWRWIKVVDPGLRAGRQAGFNPDQMATNGFQLQFFYKTVSRRGGSFEERKLKLMGVDVAYFGATRKHHPQAVRLFFEDPFVWQI